VGKIIVFTNLTLDGVMQAPGTPDEDRRGGFTHGGWAAPFGAMQEAGEAFATSPAMLFGRRTYESLHAAWSNRTDNPFTEMLDNAQKFVASRTLQEPLPWINSTLLKGDAAAAIAKLKQQFDKDLLIMGSGELIRSLMQHNLVDTYLLLIHPLVLGSGRRLFAEGGPTAALRLVDTKTTAKGVVVATYQPGEPAGKVA